MTTSSNDGHLPAAGSIVGCNNNVSMRDNFGIVTQIVTGEKSSVSPTNILQTVDWTFLKTEIKVEFRLKKHWKLRIKSEGPWRNKCVLFINDEKIAQHCFSITSILYGEVPFRHQFTLDEQPCRLLVNFWCGVADYRLWVTQERLI